MNHLKFKNNKHVSYSLLFVVISIQGSAQNTSTDFYNSINYTSVIPIGFIIGFALFMLHAFIKQKDH